MDLKLKNITIVLLILVGLVGLLGSLYMMFMINGLIVGTTSQTALTIVSDGNASTTTPMEGYIQGMETNYVDAANSLNSNVTLALKIFSVVVILALFGLGGYFAYNKFKNKDY